VTNIGTRIRELRKNKNMSLRGVAEKAGVAPSYLSRIESGKVPPSDGLLRAVAAEVGADIDELTALAGRMPSKWQKAIAAGGDGKVKAIRALLANQFTAPVTTIAFGGRRAIEDEEFPFEFISEIAEIESWRKEVHRPIYHMHKWWAQRLGSIFRALAIGAFAPSGSNVLKMFYEPVRVPGAIVLDPFMGSGTTIGEVLKLGGRAIGRDINPVAYFSVRTALRKYSTEEVVSAFEELRQRVSDDVREMYTPRSLRKQQSEVLYYFWVVVIDCPHCAAGVDLFSRYIFSQNAYPQAKPEARALCPSCGAIQEVRVDSETMLCLKCAQTVPLQTGPAGRTKATCPGCKKSFPIATTVRSSGKRPKYRMYAKMVLQEDGSKEYQSITSEDRALYANASEQLRLKEWMLPNTAITQGHNTDQVLNYCFRTWTDMFNDRQLLSIGILAEAIRKIDSQNIRELFTLLLSGTLEFNNMFASFKGEGTGAVRHMFSHHILKPERVPLEANLWGTTKSSGSFSTLFQTRILRALEYCKNPFELRPLQVDETLNGKKSAPKQKKSTEKVFSLSEPIGYDIANTFVQFCEGARVLLSCGDSAATDLEPESVDAVITDPPFFDNVHYSELADFFHTWQSFVLDGDAKTTRSDSEVQSADAAVFTNRLTNVWRECHRVLRRSGLLIFSYHHSRTEGWESLLSSLRDAGFIIVAAHPVKSEMSVAVPKHQAADPIDVDIILVCRKSLDVPHRRECTSLIAAAAEVAANQIRRFNARGRKLGVADVGLILISQIVRLLSQTGADEFTAAGTLADECIRATAERIWSQQNIVVNVPSVQQIKLW
jgi:putative DNA methylase